MTKFVLEIELGNDDTRQTCLECPCRSGQDRCRAEENFKNVNCNFTGDYYKRPDWCPLIPKEEYMKNEKLADK